MNYFQTRLRFSIQAAALALALLQAPHVLAVTAAELPVGKWVAVSSNTVASVSPCPTDGCAYSGASGQMAVMSSWSGGAFASKLGAVGSLLVFGGGHSGYLGNEVYAFDVAQGIWSRLTNPVNPPTCDYGTSTMAGNSPCAGHTNDSLEYSPITNEFVKLGSSADGESVNGSPYVHALNLQTKQWRRGARMPSWGGTIADDGEGASSAWDSHRNVMWWQGSWRAYSTTNKVLRKYDPAANTWTEYPGAQVTIFQTAAYDSQRQIFLVVDGESIGKVYGYDTSLDTPVLYELATTGDSTPLHADHIGLDYDPVTDQFVAWISGSEVYTLKAPSNWKTGTWIWTRVTAGSGSASPKANGTGTYGRFRYVPGLNAFILVNNTTEPTYMYKLSTGGGAPATGTPPTVTLSADFNSVSVGGTANLSWSSLDATSCSASGAWSGSKASTGSESVGPLAATSTFTLSCTGSGGTTSTVATVQAVASGPTISLTASPASIGPGGSSVLSWSAGTATACTASGGWSGSKAISGSQSVGPLSATATYTLSCTGAGGTNQRSAMVTVQDPTQTNNFQTRCAGPGVLQCVGFDSSADYSSSFLNPDSRGTIRGVMDTSVKASGNAALRFEIPSNSDANASGSWLGTLGKDFGPGDTMHLQFRQRFSPEMLSTIFAPGDGWKQFILYADGPSCRSLEFAMVNPYLQGFPAMYSECGNHPFIIDLQNGDYKLQQGDVTCLYHNTAGCKRYRANEWITFYLKFTLGDWRTPTTHIEAWMGYEGQALTQIVDIPNYSLAYDYSTSERLNRIMFTPYMTGKDSSQSHPVAYTWYDELIVSTQPIPAPTGTVGSPPAATPPTVTLSAQPASVISGGTTTLTWSTTNAESCTASGGWTGSKSTGGSVSVGPINQITSFTLKCFNVVGDSDSQAVQVTVGQVAPPLPEITFYADPASVELGNSSMVFWSVTNAYSCVGEDAWSGDKGTVGSEPMFLSATRRYDLVCTGNGGTSRKSITIQVVSPGQPTLTLRPNSPSIQQGSTGALTWSTTNVDSCQANGAWSGARAPSGAETVGPLAATSSFRLVCTGPGGAVEAVTQIAVTASPGGGGTGGGGTGGSATGGSATDGSTTGGSMATGPLELLFGFLSVAAASRRRCRSSRLSGH